MIPRATDDRDLEFIRRIMAGEGYRSVAKRYGVGNMTVQRVVREIEAADMAESGEPVHIVARGYASRTGRRKSA